MHFHWFFMENVANIERFGRLSLDYLFL